MRIVTLGLSIVAWLSLIAAGLSFAYYYDPTRIFFMGLKSKNSFAFDPLPNEMVEQDFSVQISLATDTDFENKQAALKNLLLGPKAEVTGFKIKGQETFIENSQAKSGIAERCDRDFIEIATPTVCKLDLYKNWASLNRLIKLDYDHGIGGYKTFMFVFEPKNKNGQGVIYHQGYASTFHDNHINLKKLVDAGYVVGALNMPTYGENMSFNKDYSVPFGVLNGRFELMERPLSLFHEPIHAMANYLKTDQQVDKISMMGLSAGAWVTALSAALDERISKSYPVAGVMPISLRQGDKERAAPQFYEPLLSTTTYLEMFALASFGPQRNQLQVFNRYDRCCFNNVRGTLYEEAVKQALGEKGRFDVLVDETHARHKISSWAMNRIMEDMRK